MVDEIVATVTDLDKKHPGKPASLPGILKQLFALSSQNKFFSSIIFESGR